MTVTPKLLIGETCDTLVKIVQAIASCRHQNYDRISCLGVLHCKRLKFQATNFLTGKSIFIKLEVGVRVFLKTQLVLWYGSLPSCMKSEESP